MKNWLKSSQNPEQVSNRIRGIVLGASGLILFLAGLIGLPLTQTDVVEAGSQIGMVAGGLWYLYGLGLKIITSFGKK